MASLTLGSLNFLSGASINSLETIQHLALCMKENGIFPELEIFDSGMISLAKYLQKHGLLPEKNYFNILLGNLNTAQATLADLVHLYSALPENSLWAGTGLGAFQFPMNVASITAGGHVRVGLEDSLYMDANKEIFATNLNLVKRVKHISEQLGRRIATPKETRALLGMKEYSC
jgi:3-keto-5-aminohexanoate cleavage enzyme